MALWSTKLCSTFSLDPRFLSTMPFCLLLHFLCVTDSQSPPLSHVHEHTSSTFSSTLWGKEPDMRISNTAAESFIPRCYFHVFKAGVKLTDECENMLLSLSSHLYNPRGSPFSHLDQLNRSVEQYICRHKVSQEKILKYIYSIYCIMYERIISSLFYFEILSTWHIAIGNPKLSVSNHQTFS